MMVNKISYRRNYIKDEQEEQELISEIYKHKWTTLSNRRLQNHGGTPHTKGMIASPLPPFLKRYSSQLQNELHLWSKEPNHVLVNEYLKDQGIDAHKDGPVYEPMVAIISLESTVLLQFTPDPFDLKYFDEKGDRREEVVDDRRPFSVILEPRSLIVFSECVYQHYLHHISHDSMIDMVHIHKNSHPIVNLLHERSDNDNVNDEIERIDGFNNVELELMRSKRISLTFRVVNKTLNRSLLRL